MGGLVGLPPAIIMDMTVREIDAYAAGADRRNRIAAALALSSAWQTANYIRAKRLPDIKGRLREIVRGNRPQTAAETRSVIEMMRRSAGKQGLPPPSALARLSGTVRGKQD